MQIEELKTKNAKIHDLGINKQDKSLSENIFKVKTV